MNSIVNLEELKQLVAIMKEAGVWKFKNNMVDITIQLGYNNGNPTAIAALAAQPKPEVSEDLEPLLYFDMEPGNEEV